MLVRKFLGWKVGMTVEGLARRKPLRFQPTGLGVSWL